MAKNYLIHYASKYYDPVKAHEYYMKNRELKGNTSTTGLNEEGQNIAKYVKKSIDESKESEYKGNESNRKTLLDTYSKDKEAKTKELNEGRNERLAAMAKEKTDSLSAEQAKRDKDLETHTNAINSQISKLRSQLEKMSDAEKSLRSSKILSDIDKLRAENDKKKEELTKAYESSRDSINSKYNSDKESENASFKNKKISD